jgi:hypothetical protein
MLPGVQRVWGNEPPQSQVNSHFGSWSLKWAPKFLERYFKGQNPIVWIFLYIIEKLLKCRCEKWACMTHLDIWNTSYDQKKGRESKWKFNSRPLKIKNQPDFLVFRHRAKYCWKALNKGYNFVLDVITIRGLHAKLWAPKVVGILAMRILGLPSGSPETECHLDVAPWRDAKNTIRGKVAVSPKSRLWWVL